MTHPPSSFSIRPHPIWALFGLVLVTVLVTPLPGVSGATTREIALDATQFEFAPGRVHVNQGDRVVITLTASDVVHGFYLDGYGLERRVEPGIAEQIAFTADRPGKFRFRCAVSCGPLHPFMVGELIVERNTPYWRAVGVVLVAAAGMLFHLWQSGKPGSSFQEVGNGTG